MTKNILCIIDFTEGSRQALKWAVECGLKYSCGITILHTYRLQRKIQGNASSWKREMEEEALEKFKDIENELLKDSGIRYKFIMEVGFVTDRIEDHISRNPIFMVVANKSTIQDAEEFEELMENVKEPVVIIPSSENGVEA